MKKIELLLDNFEVLIFQINQSNEAELVKAERKIAVSNDCLNKFRSIIRNCNFSSPKDEIKYFKYQKPLVLGKMDFYRKQKEFILEKSIRSIDKLKKSIANEFKRIDNENLKSFEFIKYYRQKKKYLDHLLFLRGNEHFEMFLEYAHQNHDPKFSTQHDYLVANIITNDLLLKFYDKQIQYFKIYESSGVIEDVLPKFIRGINWTAPKIELIELIKALEAKGVFNNGNLDMKKASDFCRLVFGVDIGNYNKAYSQIKERKKDTTKFIDNLKRCLQNKIDSENRSI